MDINTTYTVGFIFITSFLCFFLAFTYSYKFNLLFNKRKQIKNIAQKIMNDIKNIVPQKQYENNNELQKSIKNAMNSTDKLSMIFSKIDSAKKNLNETQKKLKENKKELKRIHNSPSLNIESRFEIEKNIKDINDSIQQMKEERKSLYKQIDYIFDEFNRINRIINQYKKGYKV